MSVESLKTLLEQSKMPFVYYAWPENEAPPLPWGVFLFKQSANFAADGMVYSNINQFAVELYTEKKEPHTEKQLENVFDANKIFWNKSETWIESEKMFQILYEIEV